MGADLGWRNCPAGPMKDLTMNATSQPLSRCQRIWVAIALAGLVMTSSAPATFAWISR